MDDKKQLTPEARAARAAYLREWRKRHPGKQAEYTRRSWERKAEQIREQTQQDGPDQKGGTHGLSIT